MQLVKQLTSDRLMGDAHGILKAEVYQKMLTARTVLRAARGQAKEIVAEAEAARDAVFEQARAEAMADAEQRALQDTLARSAQLEQWVDALKPKLAEAVSLAVKKVVHTIPDTTRVTHMLTHALGEMANAQELRIRIHPTQTKWLQSELPRLRKDSQFGGNIQIQADDVLAAGDCIVESALGVVDLRLEAQLKLLEHAMGSKG